MTRCQKCGVDLQHGYEQYVGATVNETLCRSCWWLREAIEELRAIAEEEERDARRVPREYDRDTPSPADGLPF